MRGRALSRTAWGIAGCGARPWFPDARMNKVELVRYRIAMLDALCVDAPGWFRRLE